MQATCPTLTDIDSCPRLREALAGPGGGPLAEELLARCDHVLVFSRHHWLKFEGDYHARAEFRARLDALRARDPSGWTDAEAELVLCLASLSAAAVGLEQLRDVVTVEEVRHVLEERLVSYLAALGQVPKNPGAIGPPALALRVRELRPRVEEHYYRYSIIDGEAWYRTEGLIPRTAVPLDEAPGEVMDLLTGIAQLPGPASAPLRDRFRAAARATLDRHGHSAPLLRSIMDTAVRDPLLKVDHATVTCPRGYLRDRPELMTGSEAFFTETRLDPELELAGHAEQIGHDSPARLQKTVRARMLKLKRKAAANYFGDGCLRGQFVEKGADYMIFRNEDAHYRGHRSIGCSTGGRAAYSVRYRQEGTARELPPMMGDFRVVRLSHRGDDLFTEADLSHVIRYASWVRAVVEETFRLDGVVLESATGGLDLHGKDGVRNAAVAVSDGAGLE